MSKLIKAAEDIRWVARRLQGFVDAAEAMERIGSLDQAVAEGEAAIAAIAQKRADAQRELDSIGQSVGLARANWAKEEERAKLAAATIISDAEELARAKLAEAKQDADAIVASAVQRGEQAEREAAARSAAIEEALVERKMELDKAVVERDKLSAELSSLEEKITAARSQIAKILGG